MKILTQIMNAPDYRAYRSWKEKESLKTQELSVVGWGLFTDTKDRSQYSVELLVVDPDPESEYIDSILLWRDQDPESIYTVLSPRMSFDSSIMEKINRELKEKERVN